MNALKPRKIVTWDLAQRILRHQEIWKDSKSIVHRLPEHYKRRYWATMVISEKMPVHWKTGDQRYVWDDHRNVWIEQEEYPIEPIYPPEADKGLWGGEGVVKGYYESPPFLKKKILPRLWIPKFWYPELSSHVFFSEILNRYMRIIVTQRTLNLIDAAGGFDFYILKTSDIDLCSKLGNKLKREMMLTIAKSSFSGYSTEQQALLVEKYKDFIIPEEEAKWVGLSLNEACAKLQDIEFTAAKIPKKFVFEQRLIAELQSGTADTEIAVQKSVKSTFKRWFNK